MAEVLLELEPVLTDSAGTVYTARACGREVDGGRWEGWIELLPSDGSPVLRSQRETTQPNRQDVDYWAGGLTAVFLEGALERTLEPRKPVYDPPPPGRPAYEGPAPTSGARTSRR